MSELKHLDVSRNRLATLPAAIAELTQLRVFDVRDNPLVEPPPLRAPPALPAPPAVTHAAPSMTSRRTTAPARKRWRLPFWPRRWRKKSAVLRQHRATQYSIPAPRARPPLDYRPSVVTPFSPPPPLAHSRKPVVASTLLSGDMNNNVHTRNYSEFTPVAAVRSAAWRPTSELPPSEVTYPTATSAAGRRPARHGVPLASDGPRSDCVTINGSVGDCLSLGDDEHAYQPVGLPDRHLAAVCSGVEKMLRAQLLNPVNERAARVVVVGRGGAGDSDGESRRDVRTGRARRSARSGRTGAFSLPRGGIFRKRSVTTRTTHNL